MSQVNINYEQLFLDAVKGNALNERGAFLDPIKEYYHNVTLSTILDILNSEHGKDLSDEVLTEKYDVSVIIHPGSEVASVAVLAKSTGEEVLVQELTAVKLAKWYESSLTQ